MPSPRRWEVCGVVSGVFWLKEREVLSVYKVASKCPSGSHSEILDRFAQTTALHLLWPTLEHSIELEWVLHTLWSTHYEAHTARQPLDRRKKIKKYSNLNTQRKISTLKVKIECLIFGANVHKWQQRKWNNFFASFWTAQPMTGLLTVTSKLLTVTWPVVY